MDGVHCIYKGGRIYVGARTCFLSAAASEQWYLQFFILQKNNGERPYVV